MPPTDAPKPSLLCFHGSGSNSTIFTVQLARLTRLLRPHFQFHYLNAPFPGPAGPGVLPFFEGCGPYYHWIPLSERLPLGEAPKVGGDPSGYVKEQFARGTMSPEAEAAIKRKVEEIRLSGSEVVGVVGFSQGSRVVAGLAKGQEIRAKLREKKEISKGKQKVGNGSVFWGGLSEDAEEWDDLLMIRFSVHLCGSYPPPLVPGSTLDLLEAPSSHPVEDASDRTTSLVTSKITTPTIHVQGLQDEWAWSGRIMIDELFEVGDAKGSCKVLEFETGHHMPVRPEETERLKNEILRVWEEVGGGSDDIGY